jgi:hypothetical protein
MRSDLTPQILIKTLNKLGHSVFESDSKPFNLNIVAIREDNPTPNKFNDLLCVFWKYKGKWSMVQWECTTLAGNSS